MNLFKSTLLTLLLSTASASSATEHSQSAERVLAGNPQSCESGMFAFSIPYNDRGRSVTFEHFANNAKCADSRSRQYQFGELHGLSTYEDCAEACVSASVQEGSIHELRGVDYNCKSRRCHCLHDEADEFVGVGPYRARGGLDNEGTGSVKNSVWANHWTCGTFSSDNAIVGGTHTYDEDESSSSARLRGSVIRSDKLFMTDEHHDMGSTDSDLPSDGSFVETELMCVAHKGVCAGSWDKSCCGGYTCQIAFPWFRCCRQGGTGVLAC